MEKLKVFQTALGLISQIYNLLKNNKNLDRDFSLQDQIKRSSMSVLANIAEGCKQTRSQNCRYLNISIGSVNETIAFLHIIQKIYQINTTNLRNDYKILGKQIFALKSKIESEKT